MRSDRLTDMGGMGKVFLTTHWSLIGEVGAGNDEKDRALIGLLLDLYWKPVYCFLRHKGYDNDSAKDLTQDFFHDVVLGRNLLQRADSSKGRFRSYLLTALKRYLINVAAAQGAQKRIPREKLVSLDGIDPAELPQALPELSAEASFDYGWTAALLERVLAEVQTQCQTDGKAIYWQAFQDRVLQPIQEGTDPPAVKEICQRYGIANGIKLSNMIVTVKRRIQAALQSQVRDSVVSDAEANGEMDILMHFFSKIAQNPE
jgi:DNA-directed RNA polymerase specialized sigma24 family protein